MQMVGTFLSLLPDDQLPTKKTTDDSVNALLCFYLLNSKCYAMQRQLKYYYERLYGLLNQSSNLVQCNIGETASVLMPN